MDGLQLDAFADEEAPAGALSSPTEPQEPAADECPLWSWVADEKDVVVEEQRRVAVYTNEWGGVVIREEGDGEDSFVLLHDAEAVRAVIAALEPYAGRRAR